MKNSFLIDVRTEEEWKFVGVPNLEQIEKKVCCLSWRLYPEMKINQNFIEKISGMFADKQTPLLFICRSGYRSLEAASMVLREGYRTCYNIKDGFEGDLDRKNRRNNINGWKFNDLPWGLS
ncbi:MAG: rhodanese-like domain-containing protein [Rickettsiaceae bacterium H1]|nr:rhodanese-like domain-containing protein [Rickettsiaceae bacterium H1]